VPRLNCNACGVPFGANRTVALGSHAVHGMLSGVIMIAAFAVVALAAGYTAVKVFRGGPHDSR
jgi:hypothetical protein